MKSMAIPDFDDFPDETSFDKILCQVENLIFEFFGKKIVLKEIDTEGEDKEFERIYFSIVSYYETKNNFVPSLSYTRSKIETIRKKSGELYEAITGAQYGEKYIENRFPGFTDCWESISDGYMILADKHNIPINEFSGPGILHRELLLFIQAVDIAISNVLPPRTEDCHDEYPETYQGPDALLRGLLAFFYVLETGEEIPYFE